eukprot:1680148-Alexandrium_andersonii.AAC.1
MNACQLPHRPAQWLARWSSLTDPVARSILSAALFHLVCSPVLGVPLGHHDVVRVALKDLAHLP